MASPLKIRRVRISYVEPDYSKRHIVLSQGPEGGPFTDIEQIPFDFQEFDQRDSEYGNPGFIYGYKFKQVSDAFDSKLFVKREANGVYLTIVRPDSMGEIQSIVYPITERVNTGIKQLILAPYDTGDPYSPEHTQPSQPYPENSYGSYGSQYHSNGSLGRKARKGRKSRKTRNARKARKVRKARKTRNRKNL